MDSEGDILASPFVGWLDRLCPNSSSGNTSELDKESDCGLDMGEPEYLLYR